MDKGESRFPPAQPLARQRAMAAARAGDNIHPDDSASGVGSVTSWSVVPEQAQMPKAAPPGLPSSSRYQVDGVPIVPKPPPEGFSKRRSAPAASSVPLDPWAEEVGKADPDDDDDEGLPEVPPDVKIGSSGQGVFHPAQFPPAFSAQGPNPATEAAKAALGKKEKQLLDQQKARAQRKGKRGLRWGQLKSVAHTQNYELPFFIQQLGSKKDERSVLVIDSRDQRISSPFQGWLLDEIMMNCQSGVNVLADRNLIRTPISGYHLSLFYMKTIDGFKVILVGSMTSYSTVPCARWDALTGDAMSHEAFQPFRWPVMRDDSPTWVDVKFKVEGVLLLHLELRGYRSDQDMTVQLNYLNDALIMDLPDQLFVPSVIVTVFQGWRVIATAFEVGGRLYACSDGGVVVALDYPLCHFELRMTAVSSKDNLGNDADKIEFRFTSVGDKINVACSQMSVPPTYMVVSRVSGVMLVKNADWCRHRKARIEGPDQIMQMSQLAGVHAHWTSAIEASSVEDTGPRVGAIEVGSHPQNLHLTCESPLFKAPKATVPKEAIALQCHDPATELEAMIVPPVTDGPSVIPIAAASSPLKALVGPAVPNMGTAVQLDAEISVTEVGQAPMPVAHGDGVVHVQRRSMDTRLSESMAAAAVTPQDFVARVEGAVGSRGRSQGGSTSAAPVSYGPPPHIEEIVDLWEQTAFLALRSSFIKYSSSWLRVVTHHNLLWKKISGAALQHVRSVNDLFGNTSRVCDSPFVLFPWFP